MTIKLPTNGLPTEDVKGQRYWHKNWRRYVRITDVQRDGDDVWYSYVADDGQEGRCFAELLLVRSEVAEVLGFDSDDAMAEHERWLAKHGSPEYQAWAAKIMPNNAGSNTAGGQQGNPSAARAWIVELGLKPSPVCNDEFPMGALHGQMQIGSQMFHVEAYQVHVDEEGIVTPVLERYADEVEALYTLSGSSLTTQMIDGNRYAIAVFPHGD